MPIRRNVWRVGGKPQALKQATLESEALLEERIIAASDILLPD